MPKIGDLVSQLQIKGKTFKNPEWWSTTHKLKRNAKDIELVKSKSKINLRTSCQITNQQTMDSDTFSRNLKTKLDLPEYSEYAPWNPIFRNNKSVIIFKKP